MATDLVGRSARAMLEAILSGQAEAGELATLARGRMGAKRAELEQALAGGVRDQHRFLLASHLTHIDFLDEQIASFDEQIAALIHQQSAPPPVAPCPSDPRPASTAASDQPTTNGTSDLTWEEAVAIWDSIPGFGRRTAEHLGAEIGTDLACFPTEAHLASWAKLCRSNTQSAGKQRSGRTGKGNRLLRHARREAAHSAVRVRHSSIGAFYRRIAARQEARHRCGGSPTPLHRLYPAAEAPTLSGCGRVRL